MATYVNDLRLKEIATGEESGTWGTSTNTNLELIAEGFSYATVDPFDTDADKTETMADGATDPIRSLYLKVTSTATLTATRTLTLAPNTVSKVWIIENATTGGQSITISQGSGSNVTIPNGDVKVIYTDGAGATAAVTDAFTDLNLAGTTTVAALDAGSGSITTTGTVTGTTLAGTLSTAAQTNITSVGTLTGLDVAGTPTFDGLTVDGSATIQASSSPALIVIDTTNSVEARLQAFNSTATVGTQSNHSFSIETNDTDRMLISSGGDISFYNDTGTSQALFWDASAERLGIGTTSPAAQLELSSATGATLRLSRDDTTVVGPNSIGSIEFYTADSDSAGVGASVDGVADGSGGNVALAFSSGTGGSATERMRIDSSGLVGIGTTSPQVRLSVDNSATGGEALRIGDTSGAGGTIGETYLGFTAYSSGTTQTYPHAWIGVLEYDTSDQKGILTFGTRQSNADVAPTEAMRIDNAGNVGIGTTSPGSILDIRQDNTGSQASIRLYNTDNSNTTTQTSAVLLSPDSRGTTGVGFAAIKENADYSTTAGRDASMAFYTLLNNSATEAMRIDSSGNLLVGKTSGTAGNLIEVNGRISAAAGSNSQPTFNCVGDTNTGINLPESDRIQFITGGSERMRIDSSGNLLVGRTTAEGNTQGLALQVNAQSKYCATFHNTGDDNGRIGIQIFAGTNNNSGTNTHISFGDGDGDGVGSITSSGGTVSYNAFTASHFVSLPNAEKESGYDYGTLVEITGVYYANPKHPRSIRYNVQKSQSSNSKKVLGAYSGNLSQSVHADTEGDYANNLHEVHVLGDGHILCNNEGGNISVGDGICTSSVAGIGMKATESPSMIIGIAQEDVTFDGSETKLVVVQYGLQQFTPWS